MSKYTTELRYICEKEAGYSESKGYNDLDNIIADSAPKIFSFDFPIFDPAYRPALTQKIIRHFYTREISEETYALWKLRLQTRMTEIMPYYNQLYKSELLSFNPLYDVDLTTTHKGERAGEQLSNEESNDAMSETSKNQQVGSAESVSTNKETGNTENVGTQTGSMRKQDSTTEQGTEAFSNDKEFAENSSGSTSEHEGEQRDSTHAGVTQTTSETSASNSDTKRDAYSDTPQGSLADLETNTYLTNARKVTDSYQGNSDSETESATSDTSSENGTKERSGSNSASKSGNANEISNRVDSRNMKSAGEQQSENTSENYSANESNAINENYTVNSAESSNEGERNSTSNKTGEFVSHNTEEYILHVLGKAAGRSYSKLLNEFRETFLNIDMMIIKNLESLFINLW